MNPKFRNCTLALLALFASFDFIPHSARAVELGPDGEPIKDAADSANKYLGNIYKDEASGIKFAPPAGAAIENRAGLELVTFVQKEKQWGGDIESVLMEKETPVGDFMQAVVTKLSQGRTFKAVQVLESRELTFGGRKAGRLTTSMESDITPLNKPNAPKQKLALYRQQLCVQVTPSQYIVLTLYTALKDRTEASATFNAMLTAFEIFDKDQVIKRRLQAIDAGRKWLAQRTAEEFKSKLITEPQLFRIKVGGKDYGYLRFDEVETRRAESKGVMIAVSSRNWLPDGRTVSAQNLAYWAYSRDEKGALRSPYSEWENTTKTIAKVSQGIDARGKPLPPTDYTFWFTEAGTISEEGGSPIDEATLAQLRKERAELMRNKNLTPNMIPPQIEKSAKQSHLLITYMGDPTQSFHELKQGINVVIPDFRPAVLPKLLEYAWPRLVDLKTPSEMTFTVLNSNTRKITLRTLSVIGPDKITVFGKSTDCIKCLDEMDNSGTTLWVDGTGKILKMLTSDQSLLEPTTTGAMQELWGTKLGLFDKK